MINVIFLTEKQQGGIMPVSGVYGLVRDSQGRPKFDDINNIPAQIWDMLTEDEQAEIEQQRAEKSAKSTSEDL